MLKSIASSDGVVPSFPTCIGSLLASSMYSTAVDVGYRCVFPSVSSDCIVWCSFPTPIGVSCVVFLSVPSLVLRLILCFFLFFFLVFTFI
jgi:hypothetical protein